MNSIKAKDLKGEDARKLEESLKSYEWFNVAKYPEAKLVLNSVENLGEGFYNVKGDFTIKGKTNPTTFEFYLNNLEAKTKVIIDRTLYDILHGSESFIVSMKDKVIYNDFEIDVNLKF
jgi:polyisoprenoid-binding protein YceI